MPRLLLALTTLAACIGEGSQPDDSATLPLETTAVYVTFVGHIESTPQWSSCSGPFPEKRSQVLDFAARFAETGAKMNLQIDFPFLEGAATCEGPETQTDYAGTDARNVVDFLAKRYGFEIDPHRSGGYEIPGEPNYADVRQIGGLVTDHITEIVGGLILTDEEQFRRLDEGATGTLPETTMTWSPEVLSMGVGFEHHLGNFDNDDRTSGIWRPAGAGEAFATHDASKRMAYIGPGQQHADWGGTCKHSFAEPVDYVRVVQRYLDDGRIPAGRIYTMSVGVPQSVMFGDREKQDALQAMIEAMQPLVDDGRIIHATYGEVAAIWESAFDAEPNQLPFDAIDPADYTCP